MAKGVDTDDLRAVRKLSIPWVYDEKHPARTYPNGAVAGNLVGFVGTDGPQAGLEKTEDECLGEHERLVDLRARRRRRAHPGQHRDHEGGRTTAAPSSSPSTATCSGSRSRRIAEQATAIGAESATAIVVRVKDGHIMAAGRLAVRRPEQRRRRRPIANLGSLAFSRVYEPGSTIKALSASMLIDQGMATPTTQVDGSLRLWKTPEGGTIKDAVRPRRRCTSPSPACSDSPRTSASRCSAQTSQPQQRYDYLTKFGFGADSGVDFQGESSRGILPLKNWDDQSNYDMLFGQGVVGHRARRSAGAYQTIGTAACGCRSRWSRAAPGRTARSSSRPQPTAVAGRLARRRPRPCVNMMESVVTGGRAAPRI